ncbi:MAG: M28 family peptidase [Chloroflexi bacterium]|nr:M28 family peptidase [Chloroflexota bacterium]MBK8933562.1 M28 family peptidase [Chloroflexota bacterium]
MNAYRTVRFIVVLVAALLGIVGCATQEMPDIRYDPAALRFDGEQAFATETEFVTQFPDRDSGQPNNRLAAEWLQAQFTEMGMTCAMQEWEVINYSQPLPLNNVVCSLPGASEQEIVVVAHLDQFAGTTQGADNDGSGIAIMLELAKLFAAEDTPPYTLTFLASDGEEYGMLGTRHYAAAHPDPDRIIAAFSLDNLGKEFYTGVRLGIQGQLRGVGPLWLQLTAQEAARAAGDLWVPAIVPTYEQVLSQAVPISLWDQGPLVAAGIPAVGFGEICPAEHAEDCWDTYHSELDTLEHQSPATLHQSGRIAEASVRQLLSMTAFPQESGPYLYFPGSNGVLRGPVLWLIFGAFIALFLVGSWWVGGKRPFSQIAHGWLTALPHFLGLWLPWVASGLLLYLLVEVGLMEKFDAYPAVARDPILFNPRWPAVIIFVVGLGLFLWLGRRLVARWQREMPAFWQRKSLTLLVVGLGGLYILLLNPFSLLFLAPLLFWFLVKGRQGVAGRVLDWALALAGGLIVYVLLYFFGFVILRNNFAILWYILMIFSIRMVSFWSMAVATAVLASGVALVVNPPVTAVSTATVTPKPADTATPPLTKTPTPKPGPTLF